MGLRVLAALQWIGLLGGAAVWAAQHLIGFGVTQAECSVGGRPWGLDNTTWQATTMAVSAALIVSALGAALFVYARTRDVSYEGAPPEARIRFFAITAIPIDVILLVIVLLDGFASIFNTACRGA
jgi:hypothetical protein